jgi:hypothetical protein
VKIIQKTAYKAITGKGSNRTNRQWNAMSGYAKKWQQLPFVSYISLTETGFGESKVSKTDKELARKEAVKQGVILLLVNLSGQ